jgi:hypothetical protein
MSWGEILAVAVVVFFVIHALRFLHMQSRLPLHKREQLLGIDLRRLKLSDREWLVNRIVGPRKFSSSVLFIVAVIAIFFAMLFFKVK